MAPSLVDMLAVADAALVIGDPASTTRRTPRASTSGRSGRATTGLPFVYAFWAGRPGVVELGRTCGGCRRRCAAGLEALPEIASRQAGRRRGPRGAATRPTCEANIVYRLGEDELAGLREFYRRAHALGLIPARPGAEVPWRMS